MCIMNAACKWIRGQSVGRKTCVGERRIRNVYRECFEKMEFQISSWRSFLNMWNFRIMANLWISNISIFKDIYTRYQFPPATHNSWFMGASWTGLSFYCRRFGIWADAQLQLITQNPNYSICSNMFQCR